MNKAKKVRLAVIGVLILTMLSGCEKEVMEVPELIEPIAVRESYRPVDYGEVSEIEVMYANVVPTDHCYFWNTATTIKKLNVQIGDYVEAGDVLAVADTKSLHDQITSIKDEIAYENAILEANNETYSYQHLELEYALAQAGSTQMTDYIDQSLKNLARLEENHFFDLQLHDFKIQQLNKQIEDCNELIDKESLIADVDGYVTYAKDQSETNQAMALENIVIISDYEDRYIDLPGLNMTRQSRAKLNLYEKFYTEINTKQYDLAEYEYTPEEQVIIYNKSLYPHIRFKTVEEVELPPVGNCLPIFMSKEEATSVLRVGKDSLYKDNSGDFVYVKNGERRDVRYVEIGERGENYCEVLSGLEEGELVSYTVTNLMPETYEPYEVELGDFAPEDQTFSYKTTSNVTGCYYSEYDGQIDEIYAFEKRVVKKGDLILKIKTDIGNAKLNDMSDEIVVLQENYDLQKKGFSDQKEGIYAQSVALASRWTAEQYMMQQQIDTGIGANGTTLTPAGIEAVRQNMENTRQGYEYQHLQLDMKKKQVECSEKAAEITYNYQKNCLEKKYAKAKEDNDGYGYVDIYADADGALYNTQMQKDQIVKKGDRLFVIIESKKTGVLFPSMANLQINQRVTFGKNQNLEYVGKIIGVANSGAVYLTTNGDDTYLTTTNTGYNTPIYLISLEDPAFYTDSLFLSLDYAMITFDDVVIVPRDVVKTESVEDEVYQYVWEIKDGMLVKQFVTTFSSSGATGGGTDPKEYIISGLKPGDILAREN